MRYIGTYALRLAKAKGAHQTLAQAAAKAKTTAERDGLLQAAEWAGPQALATEELREIATRLTQGDSQ